MFQPVPRSDPSERQSVLAFVAIVLGSVCLTLLLARLFG